MAEKTSPEYIDAVAEYQRASNVLRAAEIVFDTVRKSHSQAADRLNRAYMALRASQVKYDTDVSPSEVARIQELVAPEFETGKWETIEEEVH